MGGGGGMLCQVSRVNHATSVTVTGVPGSSGLGTRAFSRVRFRQGNPTRLATLKNLLNRPDPFLPVRFESTS